MNPKVSIVLASYNGEKYLSAQIESILDQTHRELELIVSDDASSDSSTRIVEAWSVRDSRVRLKVNERNTGYVKNFVKGLASVTGDYVAFSDQDDVWRPEKIERLLGLLQKSGKNMLAYSDLEICGEDLESLRPSFWNQAGIKPRAGRLTEKIFLRNLAPGCSMLFRKAVAESFLKLPPEIPFMHDHLAMILALGLGEIVFSREKLVRYRQHGANSIGAFGASLADQKAFFRDLRKKITYFKSAVPASPSFDLERLERFAESLEGIRAAPPGTFTDYYLFMRNDKWKDQALGFVEALSPVAYRRLKEMKGSPV